MARLLLCAGCLVTLMGLPLTANAADDAQAILDKALKAHGGADKIAKFGGTEWKAKGTMNFMDQKLPYTATYYFQQPGMIRFDMTAEIGGMNFELTVVGDGKKAWEKAMGQVQDLEDKKLKYFNHNIYLIAVSQLAPLKDKAFTLKATGESKVEGKPALGIQVSQKDRPDIFLYFDKESGLLVKSETQIWDEFSDKEVKQETFMLDYKENDGRKLFSKMVIKRDGKDFIEETFSDQKSVEKLDAKLFQKP